MQTHIDNLYKELLTLEVKAASTSAPPTGQIAGSYAASCRIENSKLKVTIGCRDYDINHWEANLSTIATEEDKPLETQIEILRYLIRAKAWYDQQTKKEITVEPITVYGTRRDQDFESYALTTYGELSVGDFHITKGHYLGVVNGTEYSGEIPNLCFTSDQVSQDTDDKNLSIIPLDPSLITFETVECLHAQDTFLGEDIQPGMALRLFDVQDSHLVLKKDRGTITTLQFDCDGRYKDMRTWAGGEETKTSAGFSIWKARIHFTYPA